MAALGKVVLALSFFLVSACRFREASETKVIPAIPAKEGNSDPSLRSATAVV